MSPIAGGGGELRGSQPMSTGAQKNFGDLTQYLTYAIPTLTPNPIVGRRVTC